MRIPAYMFALLLALPPHWLQAAPSAPDRPAPATLAHACAGCHGTLGRSVAGTPRLAGMEAARFLEAMRDFQSGRRVSSIMNRIARGYRDEDFIAMARFFAAQRP